MIDLKRVRIFYEVARLGSFSAAAAALDYSQPAISHHVARLELELGIKLLVRGSRGVTLTPAGKILMAHSTTILDAVNDAEASLSQVTGRTGRQLQIGAFATGSATLLPGAFVRFRKALPDVRLSLTEAEPDESVARLCAREINLALIFDSPAHPLPTNDQVVCTYLAQDPMLLALPADHELADLDVIPLTALQNEDWIEGAGQETPCSLILYDACARVGFEPRVTFQSGNYEVVQRLVAIGLGVALIPQLALYQPAPGIIVRRIEHPDPVRRIGVATLGAPSRATHIAAMIEALRRSSAEFQRHQAKLFPSTPIVPDVPDPAITGPSAVPTGTPDSGPPAEGAPADGAPAEAGDAAA